MSIDRKLYLAAVEDRTDMLALDAQALVDVCGSATPFVCVFIDGDVYSAARQGRP